MKTRTHQNEKREERKEIDKEKRERLTQPRQIRERERKRAQKREERKKIDKEKRERPTQPRQIRERERKRA